MKIKDDSFKKSAQAINHDPEKSEVFEKKFSESKKILKDDTFGLFKVILWGKVEYWHISIFKKKTVLE